MSHSASSWLLSRWLAKELEGKAEYPNKKGTSRFSGEKALCSSGIFCGAEAIIGGQENLLKETRICVHSKWQCSRGNYW